MAEDDNSISFESIRMLELFPVRKIRCLDFDLEKYRKLYEGLTCSFCRQIFNNPTYLRCSHRFCKECIEKHIRKNDKKSCPVCRGELTTKRDTKSDLKLISLISFAFGDPVGLQNQIDKCQEEALKNFKFVKTKSGIEMELKRDRPDSLDSKLKNLQNSSRKRTIKDNEEEELDAKKGEEKRKILVDKEMISKLEECDKQKQKQQSVSPINKLENQLLQKQGTQQNSQTQQEKKGMKVNWGNTKGKQKVTNKKKKTQIIQILSEGSNQLDASKSRVHPEELELSVNFSKFPESNNQTQMKNDRKSISNTQEQKDINLEVLEGLGQPIKESFQKDNFVSKPQQFQVVVRKSEQKFFKQIVFDQELLKARSRLKESLGNKYLSSLIARSNKPCSIKLQLAPQPKSMTPTLSKPYLQLSLQIKIGELKRFIVSKLNLQHKIGLADKIVQLSIVTSEVGKQILTESSLTLLDLLSTRWKDYKGINFFNFSSSLDKKNSAQAFKVLNYKIKHDELRYRNKAINN